MVAKKEIDIVLILGMVVIFLTIVFFGYVYYVSTPKKDDLKYFPPVVVPQVENDLLEKTVYDLNKSGKLPVEVDEFEIGKDDPYF